MRRLLSGSSGSLRRWISILYNAILLYARIFPRPPSSLTMRIFCAALFPLISNPIRKIHCLSGRSQWIKLIEARASPGPCCLQSWTALIPTPCVILKRRSVRPTIHQRPFFLLWPKRLASRWFKAFCFPPTISTANPMKKKSYSESGRLTCYQRRKHHENN